MGNRKPSRERANGEAALVSLNREIPVSHQGSSVPQFEPKSHVPSELHAPCQVSDIFWLKNCRKSSPRTNIQQKPTEQTEDQSDSLCCLSYLVFNYGSRSNSTAAEVHPHAVQFQLVECVESPTTTQANRCSTQNPSLAWEPSLEPSGLIQHS